MSFVAVVVVGSDFPVVHVHVHVHVYVAHAADGVDCLGSNDVV